MYPQLCPYPSPLRRIIACTHPHPLPKFLPAHGLVTVPREAWRRPTSSQRQIIALPTAAGAVLLPPPTDPPQGYQATESPNFRDWRAQNSGLW